MTQKRMAGLLATTGVLLLCANAYVLFTPVDTSPTDGTLSATSAASAAQLVAPPARGDVSQTTQRPLFSSTRRPPEKVADVEQPAVRDNAPGQMELRGLMKRGGRMQALIRTGDDTAGSWVALGGSRDGLRVQEIKGDVVIVELRGQRYELPMKYRSAPGNEADTSARPQ